MAAIFLRLDTERSLRANAVRSGKNRIRGKGHPTTSDPDYSGREKEFFRAIEEFKNKTGRKFPTWSEVLKVIDTLGYRKPDADPSGITTA